MTKLTLSQVIAQTSQAVKEGPLDARRAVDAKASASSAGSSTSAPQADANND